LETQAVPENPEFWLGVAFCPSSGHPDFLWEEVMTLDELRVQIDEIDAELLALINRRARCVMEIGEIKRREKVAVLDADREQRLFARLLERNEGPISEAMLRQIFQEIIDTLKVLQRPEGESSDSPAERQVS